MSTDGDGERVRALATTLREILMRLASPSSSQRDYLHRLGSSPSTDELALELDDVWPAVRPFASADLRAACDALDAWFASFSGSEHEALWYIDALDQPAWCKARELAVRALALLPDEAL